MLFKRKSLIGCVVLAASFLLGCASTASLYPVKSNGKYGYIAKSGKLAINPQFDDAGKFSQGLAPVKIGNSWGYVDTAGKLWLTDGKTLQIFTPAAGWRTVAGISGIRFLTSDTATVWIASGNELTSVSVRV